jgi:hypothetical protein
MRKAYFHGKHMDFVWYGRKGIHIRIKGDCGSFPWYIKKTMILDWMWLRKFSWARIMYVTLKREEESMEASCTFIIIMENGFMVLCWCMYLLRVCRKRKK